MTEPALPVIATTDLIAIGALVVSVFSIWWSSRIEKRIARRDDERAKFDASFGNPFSAKLDLLEPILLKIDVICASASSMTERQQQLSDLQTQDHGTWFLGCVGLLDAHDPNDVDVAVSELHTYWDQMSVYIDDISSVSEPARVRDVRSKMVKWGNRFLTRERNEIHRLRQKIK